MNIALSIMDGLPGQPAPHEATIAFENANATDHIVQHLIVRTKDFRRDGGAIILHADPTRDDHRGRHDQFQNGISVLAVMLPVIVMQKRFP